MAHVILGSTYLTIVVRRWDAASRIAFAEDHAGRIVVTVHQIVRDRAGALIVDQHVEHVYSLRDGLVCRMEITPAQKRVDHNLRSESSEARDM